jgi:hypothetical protein
MRDGFESKELFREFNVRIGGNDALVVLKKNKNGSAIYSIKIMEIVVSICII